MRKSKVDEYGNVRAQSSMEYLMTYGWAILILAIGVATLAALGIFNGGSGATNGCSTQPNFSCTNPIYSTNGIIATIGQNSGQYYYDSWVFVASAAQELAANGLPQNMSTANMVNIGELPSSQPQTFYFVSNTETTAGGIPTTNVPVGTQFTGSIWLAYCTVPGCSSPTGYAKVGTVSAKEEGTNAGFGGGTTILSTSSSTTSTTSTVTTTIHYIAITLTNTQPNPYVPITITNNNGASSPDFQQMLTITPSSFTTYETSDLGNIRFYQGSTELHSWCESGCTNTSSSATFWVLMPNGVPSGPSSLNMTFLTVGTAYDGVYAGEAPELSPTYGQYDNGAIVFPSFYTNFSGGNLNPALTDTAGSGVTISVNNGLLIRGGGSGSESDGIVYTTGTYPNYMIDIGINSISSIGGSIDPSVMDAIGSISSGCGDSNYICSGYRFGYNYWNYEELQIAWSSNSGTQGSVPCGASIGGQMGGVLTGAWTSTGSEAEYFNYGSKLSCSDGTVGLGSTNQYGFTYASNSGSASMSYWWMRLRVAPPGGVMPSASFGSIVAPQPTRSNFQQMLTIDSASYSGANEINSNWNNVEFTSGNSVNSPSNTPLYAWCESGCSNSAGSTVVWVNLGSTTISADGNAVIYMNFMPSNIMSGHTSYTGEAPQLSPVYAQYDNGASVFTYYQAWGGLSTLPNGWSYANSGGVSLSYGSTYTQLTAGGQWGGIYEAAPASTQATNYITDTDVSWSGTNEEWGTESSTNLNNPSPETYSRWTIRVNAPQFFSNCGCATSLSPTFPYSLINSFFYSATTTGTVYEGYAAASPNPVTVDTTQNPTYFYYAAGYGGGNLRIYWTRTRLAPPNGAMPTTTFILV